MTRLKRILVVEDNPHDLEMTLAALRENHVAHEVAAVTDGVEALDYLYRRGQFADRPEGLPIVILLDLKMPKMDGLEVLRQTKSDPRLKRVPVVVMTSSREEKDLVKCYDLGVNAYVVKPVDFQQFVDSVAKLGSFWAQVNEPPPAMCLAAATAP